ncbi:HAD-IIB family hydrolase [Pyrobaculum sp. 3827-6]|uniref:HAD-IIB family hydrolase n=1 Tax=Pyrobaculum sp. 3827-6 TaxID=2983604 RepID=UPI0021D9F1F9|nr:HAD-IIB family hydrolase [Pyrobaculum sp. 3827-6]MCU7788498.1 HAD-IIB family hydrolase [Pyrobaculum sp. 3827-6]
MDIALFTDYDGTLVPPEEVRRGGALPAEVEEVLRELAKRIPLAVVTTKDCGFVTQRVPFASAYACINGIEIRAGKYVAVAADLNHSAVSEVYQLASGLDAYLEPKRTGRGELAGFTVDWRGRAEPPKGLGDVVEEAERRGLKVVRYSRHPFLDVYGSTVDKGDAVRVLKALLGVRHVAYMGDSENDLPAWREADVKILVRHSLNRGFAVPGAVAVDYKDLVPYLTEVLKNFK